MNFLFIIQIYYLLETGNTYSSRNYTYWYINVILLLIWYNINIVLVLYHIINGIILIQY